MIKSMVHFYFKYAEKRDSGLLLLRREAVVFPLLQAIFRGYGMR